MFSNRLTGVLLVLSCCLLVGGCGKKASQEIDFGTLHNSIYENKYFGLRMTVPPEWSVQDRETQKKLTETGVKMLAGEDKRIKAVVEAAEMQTVYLLTVFRHPLGTPVDYNPNIICLAERVRQLPGIKAGKDYLFHAKQLMQSSQMKIEFGQNMSAEKLGGVDFDVMQTSISVGSGKVQQKLYATIMKGYALVFTVSYSSPEEEKMLDAVLKSVAFH